MDNPHSSRNPALVEDLTERELDVLRLKAQNRSNQEIADELVLALSTVKWYVRQVYGKLGVENRRQAVARAQTLGLIEGSPTPGIRPRHNLPAQTTPFIGREQERADLTALLADPEVRLITILAPGGMGKTRLGLAVAESHVDRFADGVYMVPLAPLREPDQIVTAIAEATGFPFSPDGRSPRRQVLDFLCNKHMLLLLDNFEHLLAGAGLVTEILHAAPAVQVVITSRERLHLSGEAVYTVGGMIFPDWETPEDALEYDAVKLFMQRAELCCPGFEIHSDNLRYLARICRLVEGMPLGIVLAAAWTEVLSLEEIAGEIQGSFDFLAAEMRDVPRRQWSIRAVFEPTWNRLTDSERDVFMRFSAFRGGATRDAAQAVTGAELRTLQALINKALLDRDPAGRYQMHELLRQYAEQQLEAAGDMDATRNAHSAYYVNFVRERETDLKYGQRLEIVRETEIEFENVSVAWRWAVAQHDYEALDQMILGLGHFAARTGRENEVTALLHHMRESLNLPGEKALRLWAWYLVWCGLMNAKWDITLAEQCMTIASQDDDPVLKACSLCYYVQCHTYVGDPSDALVIFEDTLNHFRTLNDPHCLTNILYYYTFCFDRIGRFDKSVELIQQGIEISRTANQLMRLAMFLEVYGESAAFYSGNYPKAKRLISEALAIAKEISYPVGEALSSNVLGSIFFFTGDFEAAKSSFEAALTIAEDFNYIGHRTNGLGGLALLAAIGGDYDAARHHCEQIQTLDAEPRVLSLLACAVMACCHKAYSEVGHYLQTFLERSYRYQLFSRMATGLPIAAILRGQSGDPSGAAELLGLAFTHPKSPTGWMERWDLLTQFRADLEADLGSDAYHAAWERGAALDLETVIADLLAEMSDEGESRSERDSPSPPGGEGAGG